MKSCLPPTVAGRSRRGKVLALLAVMFPMLLGFLGLVVDGSLLMVESRVQQQVTDAAATAAAWALSQSDSVDDATRSAEEFVWDRNGLEDAEIAIHIGPTNGPYAGDGDYVEVIVTRQVPTYFIQVLRSEAVQTVETRAVAGIEDVTGEAAVVVLDPDPPGITLTGLPLSLPSLPSAHLGGLEALGVGTLNVEGAVLVNTAWGGVDENGDAVGQPDCLRNAMTCTPLIPLSKLQATDIRVVGGVDNPHNYGHVDAGEPSPLKANRCPVPDPLIDLPVPTVLADGVNVVAEDHGAVSVVNIPLLAPPVVLEPGVYDWISVVTGPVIFEPGVYIIRSVNPVTQMALSITAGPVTAEGVMFYITDSAGYSAGNGFPDAADGETVPPNPSQRSMIPSVVINAGVLGTVFSPLEDSGSPFDGILLYQRRVDRRPILLVAEQLLSTTNLSGTVYAKWGHVALVANGTYDLAITAGSVRVVNALTCTLQPSVLFPPARDVYVVE